MELLNFFFYIIPTSMSFQNSRPTIPRVNTPARSPSSISASFILFFYLPSFFLNFVVFIYSVR